MEIERISYSDYKNYFPQPYHIFNSTAFSELNRNKCKELHYLLFKDSKVRFGIVLGEYGQELKSPFSAPFGGFSYVRNEKVEHFEQAVELLKNYGENNGKHIVITLPPVIYNPSFVTKNVSAFLRGGGRVRHMDINYHFEVNKFGEYEALLDTKTRNKLHNSMKHNFEFVELNSQKDNDVSRAYEVIRLNREKRGFPLRMSLEAVLDTIKIIKADFFVMSYDHTDVAAAQIFHVSPGIAQVIYWGDIPEYSDLRVMNYFSYKVFEHYYRKGLGILDIGPATENGIPNYGLCEFKENIGCTASLKYCITI